VAQSPVRCVVTHPGALAEILAAHAAAGEAEPCGALLGRVDGDRVVIEAFQAARNAHPAPAAAFLLHPEDALEAHRAAAGRGLRVVGTWHAHRRGGAFPSEADAAGLAAASLAPGQDGVPAQVPHVFAISGRGSGNATVLRAFLPDGDRPPREVRLRIVRSRRAD
jgi:proteasome lid subunit RPN8/RPN11